uniref:hypothetical protein n=1 Tax=Marinobacterium profundum TaxID=1714300 RepID=UPI00082C3EE3|nr:hypothetical protein [Marinobacterium profundum]
MLKIGQELWGTLLAYKLLRFQMVLMAYSLKGRHPCQISFSQAAGMIINELILLPAISSGKVPAVQRLVHLVLQTDHALLRLHDRINLIPQMCNAKIPSSLGREDCCRI